MASLQMAKRGSTGKQEDWKLGDKDKTSLGTMAQRSRMEQF